MKNKFLEKRKFRQMFIRADMCFQDISLLSGKCVFWQMLIPEKNVLENVFLANIFLGGVMIPL